MSGAQAQAGEVDIPAPLRAPLPSSTKMKTVPRKMSDAALVTTVDTLRSLPLVQKHLWPAQTTVCPPCLAQSLGRPSLPPHRPLFFSFPAPPFPSGVYSLSAWHHLRPVARAERPRSSVSGGVRLADRPGTGPNLSLARQSAKTVSPLTFLSPSICHLCWPHSCSLGAIVTALPASLLTLCARRRQLVADCRFLFCVLFFTFYCFFMGAVFFSLSAPCPSLV